MQLTGAEIILECLSREGVDTIYGHPGGAILPTYDAMTRYPQIHHVLVRHEQGASHMADGYARATGKVGVAIATSGPGATNLVTGLATAMMDSSPIVCITGQVPTPAIGSDAFQECDVTGVTLPVTKHNYLVTDVEELAYTMKEAFFLARSGRPGPVLVDVPKDVQNAKCEFHYPEGDIELPGYRKLPAPTTDEIRQAAELINQAERPVILAGQGVIHSGAGDIVRQFAEFTNTPISFTLLGKGGVPETHPLSLGMMGMHGTGQSNAAIQNADLLLAFGMRFDDRVTGNLKTYATKAKKLHIDIDASELNKNVRVDVGIVGDLKTVLEAVIPEVESRERPDWWAKLNEWIDDTRDRDIIHKDAEGKLPAAHVIDDIFKATNGEAIVVTDVGQHQMWEAQYYPHNKPRTLLTSGGLGTMGFGMPAAIGAAMGLKSNNVWAIVGDGGFQMTLCELATAVQERVPIKICVINNGFLGMVRQWQEMFFDQRYHATPMLSPNFTKLAEAYGIPSKQVKCCSEAKEALEWAKGMNDGPVLIEFVVESHDIVYPMVPAGADLDNMIRRPATNAV
jgi:acetolactate synthase I/II/III large subunit